MAKVKSPLLSFSASGQIAKSIVFSSWKGIDDVRQYVIPANPKSDGQIAQRALMTTAVALWHSTPRNTYDAAAFNILAAQEAKPMSGFNVFCKRVIASEMAEDLTLPANGLTVVTNVGGALEGQITLVTGKAIKVQIGLKPSVLGAPEVCAEDGATGNYDYAFADLEVNTDYYLKFSTTTAATTVVSGIYKIRTGAAV